MVDPQIKAIGTSALRIMQSKNQDDVLEKIALSAKANRKTVFLAGVQEMSVALAARSLDIRYIAGEYLGTRFLKSTGVRTLSVPKIIVQ